MKQQLQKHFSQKEHHPHSTSDLLTTRQEEWKKIDKDTNDKLIDSMPSIIQGAIKANGGRTVLEIGILEHGGLPLCAFLPILGLMGPRLWLEVLVPKAQQHYSKGSDMPFWFCRACFCAHLRAEGACFH